MTRVFHEERLMRILIAPQISEKATYISDNRNQATFFVLPNATKQEIKAAVEMLFKVSVKSVAVVNKKGKLKRAGRNIGQRNNLKKAFVSLALGHKLDFSFLKDGL